MSQPVRHALAASVRFSRPTGPSFEEIMLGEFAGTALALGLYQSTRLLLPSATNSWWTLADERRSRSPVRSS